MRDFWEHYPAWFYVISSFFFEFYAKTNIPGNHYSSALFIFPLSAFVLYIMVVGKKKNDKYYPLIRITVVLIIWGLIEKLTPPLHYSESTLKWIYEISNFILWSFLVIHAYRFLGKKAVIEFFVITLLYGFSLESSGVTMGFFFEDNYHVYLPLLSAPLVTMIGWSSVFYVSFFMFEKIREIDFPLFKNILGGALTITLIALLWDMSIDPVASSPYIKFWRWNPQLAHQAAFMGVPVLNFVSWFWAVFVYALFFLTYRKKNYPEKKGYLYLILFAIISQFLAGFGVFSTMSIIEGINGPSMRILESFF